LVCGGDEVTLEGVVSGGMGGITYLWNNSVTDTDYTFTPTSNTNVVLVVTDSCGLSEQDNATVTVDNIDASFTYFLTGPSTVQFTNTTVGAITYDWDFGDGLGSTGEAPLHEYEEDGTYLVTLTVTNANGCETTVEDSVTVYPPLRVYVPNSFTPNADGLNDFFGVVGEGFTYYDLEIFDRWGQKLLSGRFEDAEAWDGTVNGRPVPTGVYIYRLWVEPPIGIEVKESGAIYVIAGE
jgi:gliding motility-associated-like protein